jgi:hypothetical protein
VAGGLQVQTEEPQAGARARAARPASQRAPASLSLWPAIGDKSGGEPFEGGSGAKPGEMMRGKTKWSTGISWASTRSPRRGGAGGGGLPGQTGRKTSPRAGLGRAEASVGRTD